MIFDPEQFIDLTLKAGAVYKFEDKQAIEDDEPHFFIVINNDPNNELILLLTCISSQINKARQRIAKRNQHPYTLVEFKEDEYDFLTKDSIVDCNEIFPKSKADLVKKCSEGTLKILAAEIDKKKLQELQNGFLISNMHSNSIKRIIDPKI